MVSLSDRLDIVNTSPTQTVSLELKKSTLYGTFTVILIGFSKPSTVSGVITGLQTPPLPFTLS